MAIGHGALARAAIALALILTGFDLVLGFRAEREPSRFDPLVIGDPSLGLNAASQSVDALPAGDPVRAGWDRFRADYGSRWSVVLDRRSGVPLLVEGQGVPWFAGTGNALPATEQPTLESLERSLRRFLSRHRPLLLADDAELVLNRAASGPLTAETW